MGLPLLNPSLIAEGSKPVDVPDPMEQMRAIEQLRQVRNQNALAPLRAQELQGQVQEAQANADKTRIANENARRDQEDDKAYQQALLEAGGDPDKIEAAATKITNPNVQSKLASTASLVRDRNSKISIRKHEEFGKQGLQIANNLEAIRKAQGPVKTDLWAQEVKNAETLKDEQDKPIFQPGQLDPNTVPDDSTLSSLQDYVDRNGQFHLQQAKLKDENEKAAQKAGKDLQDKQKADRETLKGLHEEAADQFSGIANKEDYDKAVADFAAIDDAHKKYADRWLKVLPYSDKSTGIIAGRAMNTKDRMELAAKGADKPPTNAIEVALQWAKLKGKREGWTDDQIYDQALTRMSEETKDAKFAPNVAGGRVDAQQKKEFVKNYDSATDEEKTLYGQLQTYENALKNGSFVAQVGTGDKRVVKPVPMDTFTKGDDAKKAQATQVLKDSADEIRERIKGAIKKKYDYAERLGMGHAVDVSGAVDQVEAGKYKHGQQQDQGTVTPPQGGAGVINRIKSAFVPPATPSTQPSIGSVTRAPVAPAPQANTVTPSAGGKVKGLITAGNIDITQRPDVKNSDGSRSTVRSMSFEEGGKEILIPTVVGNKVVSDDEAIAEYHKTGKHLGMFDNPESATSYAKQLHNDYESGKIKNTPPAATQSVTYKGTTYSVGQKFMQGGKPVKIVGFQNGKPLTAPDQ